LGAANTRRTPSGQAIRVPHEDGPYWAFVPDRLPPELSYEAELVGRLSEADRALGQLAGQARSMPNPHLLIRPFIRREAVLSSRIEGTETEVEELYAYEAGQIRLPGFEARADGHDVREVYNYVKALEYGLKRLATLPVSLRLMCELHERLLEGVRGRHANLGRFRASQNWVGADGCRVQEALFIPPPVPQMREALYALEQYLHCGEQNPPLVRLALIHYQFEAIHPFVDGNGRIGRLLVSLLLVHWDLLPLALLYLSAFFERRRKDYIRLLRSVSNQGTWQDWVLFFLEGISTEASDATVRARRLQDLRARWRELVTAARTSALALRLVDYLFEAPIITIPQAARVLDVTYPSGQRNVEKLLTAGILRQLGEESYGKTFVADEIINIIAHPNPSAPPQL